MTLKATISSRAPTCETSGSKSCSEFFSSSTRPAPTTAPAIWPRPPATTISRYSIDARTSKGVGLTKRFMCA